MRVCREPPRPGDSYCIGSRCSAVTVVAGYRGWPDRGAGGSAGVVEEGVVTSLCWRCEAGLPEGEGRGAVHSGSWGSGGQPLAAAPTVPALIGEGLAQVSHKGMGMALGVGFRHGCSRGGREGGAGISIGG